MRYFILLLSLFILVTPVFATRYVDESIDIKNVETQNPRYSEEESTQIQKPSETEEQKAVVKQTEFFPRVTINARGVSLRSLLDLIFNSLTQGYTYTISNETANRYPSVFLYAQDESLDAVMQKLSKQLDLYIQYDPVIRNFQISPLVIRTFTVPFPPLKQKFTAVVTNETISQTQSSAGSSTGQQSGAPSVQSGGSTKSTQETTSAMEEGLWEVIRNDLTRLITGTGWFTINKASSTVIVACPPSNMHAFEEYFAGLEKELMKQVMLEVKIVEVVLNDSVEGGVDWNKIVALPHTSSMRTFTFLNQVAGANSPSTAVQLRYQGVNTEAIVRALSDYGKVNVVSQPKLFSLNNQPAIIQLTTGTTYVSNITTTATEGSTSTSVQTSTLQTGVSLYLVPYIRNDGKVTVFFTPIITDLKNMKQVTVENVQLELPTVDQRAYGGTVVIENGDTIVIGGLKTRKQADVRTGIPVLSKIPVIGALFGYQKKVESSVELVILLNARVVDMNLGHRPERAEM